MSSVELLSLPDLTLAKILSYIPDHFTNASVCKKFYEMDCFNSHKNSNIMFRWPIKKEKGNYLESILESKRPVRRMFFEVDFNNAEEVEIVKKIFRHHGTSVTELELHGQEKEAKVSEETLIQLLNCFPNLRKFLILLKRTDVVQGDNGTEEVLKLPKLEKLTICFKTLAFFKNRLPENLRKFGMNFAEPFSREGVVTEEDRSLYADKLDLLEKLRVFKLEELFMLDCSTLPINWPAFRSLLMIQRDSLKSLWLIANDDFESQFLLEINSFKELESLEIRKFANRSSESFSKLTKLKRLNVSYGLEEISLIKTVPVENLTIEEATAEVLQQIGQNYPIKSLKILFPAQQNLKFFMKTFPHLESLELSYESEFLLETIGIYTHERIFYPKLKKLTLISFGDPASDLPIDYVFEILIAFPNLEELYMDQKTIISGEFLGILAKSLGRLRKLTIMGLEIKLNEFCTEESIQAVQKLSRALTSVKLQFFFKECQNANYEWFHRLQGYFKTEVGEDFITFST